MATLNEIVRDMEDKRRELASISARIERLPGGPVRMELKRRRAGLTGEIVNLRQELIKLQFDAEEPQHIARETFGASEPEDEEKIDEDAFEERN